MKIANLFLILSLACVANGPLYAASGLSTKAYTGLAAAAGSMLASGLIAIADTIKNDKLANAQAYIVQLENEHNYHIASKLMDMSFKDGLIIGSMFTILAGTLFIGWLINTPDAKEKNDKQE